MSAAFGLKNVASDPELILGIVHFPPTRVVALENTLSGTILPLEDARQISEFVHNYPVSAGQESIAMHLDGARLFDAVAAEGVRLRDYCSHFDSISFCLAKGIGAPMGSVIVGSTKFIERTKWFRKMFGGGTRQVCDRRYSAQYRADLFLAVARYDGSCGDCSA